MKKCDIVLNHILVVITLRSTLCNSNLFLSLFFFQVKHFYLFWQVVVTLKKT